MTPPLESEKFRVPYSEFGFSFVRSSGPGGQNVNKVNSKAVLRWNLFRTSCFSPDELRRVLERLHSRLNEDGDLVIKSDRYRDQKKNKDDCIEKCIALIEASLHIPKTRKDTKPTRGSRRRKLEKKSRDGEKKRLREKVRL